MKSLEEEVEILTKLTKAIKLVWRITEVPKSGHSSRILKRFQVAGYNLDFCVYPQTGLSYDKLKWPFKAEFVIHSQNNPGNFKQFKSEVFERKRENFSFMSPTTIATFTTDEFLEHFINGEAEFEIFVIIL